MALACAIAQTMPRLGMLSSQDLALANQKPQIPQAPADPRTIKCAVTGAVVGYWRGKITGK